MGAAKIAAPYFFQVFWKIKNRHFKIAAPHFSKKSGGAYAPPDSIIYFCSTTAVVVLTSNTPPAAVPAPFVLNITVTFSLPAVSSDGIL